MNENHESTIPMEIGQKIRIHLPEGKMWTLVRGWLAPHVILVDMPSREDPVWDLETKAPCLVQYLREGVIHSFKTEILGVVDVFNMTNLMGMRFPDQIKSQNLRSFPRVKIQVPAKVFEPKGKSLKSVILDISRGGCRADIPKAILNPGDSLHIAFTLPNQPQADIPCEVRRCCGVDQYGLEFKELNGENRKAVDDFLSGFAIVQPAGSIKELKQGMVGNIEDVSVPDLLQILANSRRPYQVDFVHDSDWAQVYLKEGEVFYAKTSHGEGADAIFRLISWGKGVYRIQLAEWIPDRNVTATLEHLLLEYVYRQDRNSLNGDRINAAS
jgi:c-di-GMP-binding flagellar brake protein YcgR